MANRNKRPTEFRCLIGMAYGILALVMAGVLNKLNEALCTLLSAQSKIQACALGPADFIHLLYWVAAAGCVFTCYRAYRDFYVGDYYLDLVNQDHR